MKKLLTLILAATLIATSAAIFASCGDDTDSTTGGNTEATTTVTTTAVDVVTTTAPEVTTAVPSLAGIKFEDKTVTYDGNKHTLTVTGDIPAGVEIVYMNNEATAVGVYSAGAGVYYNGEYQTYLFATLTIKAPETTTEVTTVVTTIPETTTIIPETTTAPNVTENDPNKKDITGITLSDATVKYNGKEQWIEIKGTLPKGVSVTYKSNGAKNVGKYTVSAILSGDGYNTLQLDATLTIEKGDLTFLVLPSRAFYADGSEHSLTVEGNIPENVKIEYTGNSATAVGTYDVSATISGDNYNTYKLSAKMVLINTRLEKTPAAATLNALLNTPEVWETLPDIITPSGRKVSGSLNVDFDAFTTLDKIPTGGVGIQLVNALELMSEADQSLAVVERFFNTYYNDMVEIYQAFLVKADDGEKFEVNAGDYTMTIMADDQIVTAVFVYGALEVEISYDETNEKTVCRFERNGEDNYKFEFTENTFTVAADIEDGDAWRVDYSKAKNGDLSYNFYRNVQDNKGKYTLEVATLSVTDDFATIIGNVGEYEFASTGRTCEIYDMETGLLMAMETAQTHKDVILTTLWVNLYDVNGIDNIMVEPSTDKDRANPNVVYINDSKNAFKSFVRDKDMGVRVYDIEMVNLYFYETEEDIASDYSELSVPMLFVQRDSYDTYAPMAIAENFDSGFGIADVVSDKMTLKFTAKEVNTIHREYDSILDVFAAVRGNGDEEKIADYIGETIIVTEE